MITILSIHFLKNILITSVNKRTVTTVSSAWCLLYTDNHTNKGVYTNAILDVYCSPLWLWNLDKNKSFLNASLPVSLPQWIPDVSAPRRVQLPSSILFLFRTCPCTECQLYVLWGRWVSDIVENAERLLTRSPRTHPTWTLYALYNRDRERFRTFRNVG